MALPSAFPEPSMGAYPNPAGGGFPASPAASDPMFGVNPWMHSERLYVPKLFNPSAGIPDLAQRAAQRAMFTNQLQLAGLQSLGVPVADDPTQWTPEQAAKQTDQAIAKIAQVNPDLAKQLAEQRDGGNIHDGEGFWGSLKDLAGDIFAPVLSIGGKLLDVIGRTAHIVPSVIMDASNGGGFDPLEDIGGALTGKDKTAWADVLRKWGVDVPFLTGALGFIGDVATDPLTWLTLGTGPVAESGAKAAEMVGTKSEAVWTAARKALIGADDETIAAHLAERFREMTKGIGTQGAKLGDDTAERAFGLIRHQWDASEQEMLRDMFELSDRSYRWFRTGTFGTALRKDASITLTSGRTVGAREVKGLLDDVVKAGAWTGRGDDVWGAARDAASAMRGLRLRGAIPFTKLRYISPALPGTRGLGFLGLNRARQLFAGQFGMSRLISLGASEAIPQELADKALVTWMEGGFTKLAQDPELGKVAEMLKGRGRNLGPALYTASEGLGRITEHLSTGARASRAGFVGYLADKESKQIRSIVEHFLHETGYAAMDQKGQSGRDALLREMETNLGLSLRKGKNTASPDEMWDMARYLDFFPPGVDVGTPDAISDWFWQLPEPSAAKAISGMSPFGIDTEAETALMKQQMRLQEMQDVASRVRVDPHRKATLDKLSAVWDNARREAGKYDAFLSDVRANYDEVGRLAPEQVGTWQGYVDTELKGEWGIDLGTSGNARLGSHGVTDEAVTSGERLRGVHLTRTSGVATTKHRAVVRAKNLIVMDAEVAEDATAGAGAILRTAEEEADGILRQHQDAVNELAGLPSLRTAAGAADSAERRVELVTEHVRKMHPESDGVVFRHSDGRQDLVIFDHKNVKTVHESAPQLVNERGFFHRRFTRELTEYIRGQRERGALKLLVENPELEAKVMRKTRGMTLSEAEDFVRKNYFPELPENIRVWDTDVLSVHERYLNSVAEAIQSELLGKVSRRFVTLGDVAPALFGNSPRQRVFEWVMNPSYLRALKKLDTKTANAILKANERGTQYMEAQHAKLAKDAETVGELSALIDESLSTGAEVPDRVVATLRRWGHTASEADSRINRELDAVGKHQAYLDDQDALLDTARRSLKDNETLHHPGSGEQMAVYDLPDGRVEVRGWHGTIEIGGVEPVYGLRPDELRFGGFHMGAYDAAGDRVIQRASEEDAVGFWRADVPETVQLVDADGTIISSRNMRPGETRDEAAASIKPEGAEGTVEFERVHADVYAEDHLHPVVVRGRIYGLEKPGQGTLPGSDQLWFENDIHPELVYGGYKDVPREQLKAKRSSLDSALGTQTGAAAYSPKELREAGYDGIAYINTVEGVRSKEPTISVAMFDPKNVYVSEPAQLVDRLAEQGELFLGPNGDVLTRAGYLRLGGKKVQAPSAIARERARLLDRQMELEDLRKNLRSGAGVLPTVERRVDEAAAAVGREVGARAKGVAREVAGAERRLQRLRTMTNLAMNEANKAYAEAHGLVTRARPALVKVEGASDLTGMIPLRVPGLHGYAMPAYIAEEFHHLVETHNVGHIRQEWRRWVLGPWKRWATYRWPGFHVRNTFGAWFNNLLGGVNDLDYVFSWRVNRAREGLSKWADRQVSPEEFARYHLERVFGQDAKVTYDDMASLLGDMGIGRANTMSVYGAADAAGEFHEAYRARGSNAAAKLWHRYDDRMRSVGTGIEDFHRVAAWARGMAATTGDTYGARTFVMMRHGDYSDLTETEEVIRDLVPFYKWMRTNTPYQFRMLAEHPGLLTVPDKLKTAAYETQGLNRQEAELQQPTWMKESMAIPIPSWVPVVGSKDPEHLKFAMFDLPYADLYNGLTDYLSSALPVVRNVIESYGIGQTVFSGQPLTGEYKELSGPFNLPGVRDVLQAMKLARKGADGKVYMEDKLQNVMMGWPIYSRFRNFVEGEPERVQARLGGLFSMMAGFNIKDGDFTEAELDFYYNEVRPLLDQYRSLGVNFPSFQDVQSGPVGSALGLNAPSDIDVNSAYAQGVLSRAQGTGAIARSVKLPSGTGKAA